MRALMTLALMMVVMVVGCAAPSIGEYPDADRKAPKRSQASADDDDDDDSSSNSDDGDAPGTGSTTSTTTKPPVGQALTIASTGGGQGDITCNGGPCTATFAPGAKVTLAATPKAGSFFSGWSGGGCSGSGPCTHTVGDGAAPSAKFETISGSWTGTYTNNRPAGGCNFKNAGNVTQEIGGAVGAYTAAVTAMNGLEIRNSGNCAVVDSRNGVAAAQAAQIDGDTVTGVWNVRVDGFSSTLPFPFTAKLSGNKMTGTWTCTGCSGGFELTKQ